MNRRAYICGPMRGFPSLNFPAFDECRDRLRALGYDPVSPADIDRQNGIDPENVAVTRDLLRQVITRDINALIGCDVIACLPGWKSSLGAKAEVAVARWLGLEVIDAWTLKPVKES